MGRFAGRFTCRNGLVPAGIDIADATNRHLTKQPGLRERNHRLIHSGQEGFACLATFWPRRPI